MNAAAFMQPHRLPNVGTAAASQSAFVERFYFLAEQRYAVKVFFPIWLD